MRHVALILRRKIAKTFLQNPGVAPREVARLVGMNTPDNLDRYYLREAGGLDNFLKLYG